MNDPSRLAPKRPTQWSTQHCLRFFLLALSAAALLSTAAAPLSAQELLDQFEQWDRVGWSLAVGDFDGNTIEDLAIGARGESQGPSSSSSGAAHVTYGTPNGLTTANQQFWHQNSPGVAGWAETGDWFAEALAAGDFNCDNYADLAVGVPGESLTISGVTYGAVGAVHIFYGSSNGLTSAGSQMWHPGQAAIGRLATAHNFGDSLAVGDFNGDRCSDLAVGAPRTQVAGAPQAGAVRVLLGSPAGLTSSGQWFDEAMSSLAGDVASNDQFGFALATGDLDADGFDELIIGSPYEDVGTLLDAGEVVVLQGSFSGLTALGAQRLNQASTGTETPEAQDYFGWSVIAGDFGGDPALDLAIGAPRETRSSSQTWSGVVHVLYSSVGTGWSNLGAQLWHQDSWDGASIAGWSEHRDYFGWALAAGNFRTWQKQDLVISAVGEAIVGWNLGSEGAVHVIYTDLALGRLSAVGNQMWHQNVAGISETCEFADEFGFSLAVGNFDAVQSFAASPFLDDLAIGVPGEGHTSSSAYWMGAVHVITGGSPNVGLTATGEQFWKQAP